MLRYSKLWSVKFGKKMKKTAFNQLSVFNLSRKVLMRAVYIHLKAPAIPSAPPLSPKRKKRKEGKNNFLHPHRNCYGCLKSLPDTSHSSSACWVIRRLDRRANDQVRAHFNTPIHACAGACARKLLSRLLRGLGAFRNANVTCTSTTALKGDTPWLGVFAVAVLLPFRSIPFAWLARRNSTSTWAHQRKHLRFCSSVLWVASNSGFDSALIFAYIWTYSALALAAGKGLWIVWV